MGTAARITVKLGTDTTEYSKGFEKAKDTHKAFFKDLKSQFGKTSVLGQSLKLAAGGGAIAALGMAGREFKELTEKAKAFAIEAHNGGKSAGEIAEGLVQSIPVIGNVYEGFKNIAEIVSGLAVKIADMNAEVANQDAVTAAMGHTLSSHKKTAADIEEIWRKTYQHIALIGKGEIEKALLTNADSLVNTVADAKKKAAAASANADDKKRLAEMIKARAAMVTPSGNEGQSSLGGPSWTQFFGGHDTDADAAVAAALEKQGKLDANIKRMKKQIADQETDIEKEKNATISAANRIFWAEQTQTVKEGAQKVYDYFSEGFDKWTKKQEETKEKVDKSLEKFFDFEDKAPKEEKVAKHRAERVNPLEVRGGAFRTPFSSESDPLVRIQQQALVAANKSANTLDALLILQRQQQQAAFNGNTTDIGF